MYTPKIEIYAIFSNMSIVKIAWILETNLKITLHKTCPKVISVEDNLISVTSYKTRGIEFSLSLIKNKFLNLDSINYNQNEMLIEMNISNHKNIFFKKCNVDNLLVLENYHEDSSLILEIFKKYDKNAYINKIFQNNKNLKKDYQVILDVLGY